MNDIYKRLNRLGFKRAFVRSVFLPDWWEDSLAAIPANRAIAEASIAKFLGMKPSDLADPNCNLELPHLIPFRLKSATRGTDPGTILPSVNIAHRVAEFLSRSTSLSVFKPGLKAAKRVRESILNDCCTVTLESLLQYCSSEGIIVAHIEHLPVAPGFRKFDGIVMFIDQRPCILLAEKNDAPGNLAFHLAHELGHLLLEHVTPGAELLADGNLSQIVTDEIEKAADEFACEVLTGFPEPKTNAIHGLTGEKLAGLATIVGKKKQIDPGVLVLVYGRNADRMGASMKALQALNVSNGAREQIRAALLNHISLDELTDSQTQFIEYLTRVHCEAV